MSSSEDGVIELDMGSGDKLTVFRYQGRLWPAFNPASIAGVATFQARDDDVIVVAYPKSGTHWIWELIRLLRAGTTDVPLIEKDVAMIEDVLPEKLEAIPSPRSLNTHAHFELMPADVMANRKCKLVYVSRDPRDVAVSFYNHHRKLAHLYKYHGPWSDYLQNFTSGNVDYESWFAYTKGWEQGIKDNPQLQIHVTSYEAFQEDTRTEVEKLAKFLETPSDSAFIQKVINKASFDNMRNTKGANEKFKGNTSPVMYRKGKVGDWKNWFTVGQSEQFDAFFDREMAGTAAFDLYSASKQDITDGNMNVR